MSIFVKKSTINYCYIILAIVMFGSCTSRSARVQNSSKLVETSRSVSTSKKTESSIVSNDNLQKNRDVKAHIFLENSGSMFGYVKQGDFVSVVSQIAGDCDIQCSHVDYVLTNGRDTKLGSALTSFTKALTVSGIRKGDPSKSDLSRMFEKALNVAVDGDVSILISDGIYSVNGTAQSLINKLKSESIVTRNKFIKRLQTENLTTVMIKLQSMFDGYYYPASKGRKKIKQNRPYYVWVIGQTKDIDYVFGKDYFRQLQGFVSEMKFAKYSNLEPQMGFVEYHTSGTSRYNPSGLILDNVFPRNNVTSFSVALDFTDMPFSMSYFDQQGIYTNDLGYKVTSVVRKKDLSKREQQSAQNNVRDHFSHVVTMECSKSPWGTMHLCVENKTPQWVDKTHDDNDQDIVGDTDHTFGFKYLVEGIDLAYKKVNKSANIAVYDIQINK